MPIHEYQCVECRAKFEKLVRSMSSPASQVKCPKCGKETVEKLLSSFGVAASSSSGEPACPFCAPAR
jgi:putative FmdB family regulatory protein